MVCKGVGQLSILCLAGTLLGSASGELFRVTHGTNTRKALERPHTRSYGSSITEAECHGVDREKELQMLYQGTSHPYALTGPASHCNAEGCMHKYWGSRARLRAFDEAPYFQPCKPQLRQKLTSYLYSMAKNGGRWAQEAILAKPCQLFPLLQGRTLWILGDSLSEDFADSLAGYLVEYHVYDISLRRPITTDEELLRLLSVDSGIEYNAWCQEMEGNTRVCYSRAMKVARLLKLLEVLPQLAEKNDIVILNVGLHYNDMVTLEQDMAEFEAAFPSRREALADQLFMWRESTPQHFDSPTGSYIVDHFPEDDSTCKPVGSSLGIEITVNPDGSIAPQPGSSSPEEASPNAQSLELVLSGGPRNVVTQPVVDRLGLPTLRVWNASLPLWELHPYSKDCTHFCPPNWAHLHFGALRESLSQLLGTQTAE